MSARPILLLGDRRLRIRSAEVSQHDLATVSFRTACSQLADTLGAFRAEHGFGRAISAPQIGVPIRLIAVNLGSGTFFVVNPEVTHRSSATFSMWDDCMSFPDLLVRLSRHESISLRYIDETGKEHEWRDLDLAASELLQHEIDHLDGVLAVDRALDRDSFVLKVQFDANVEEYASMVDYTIAGGRRPQPVA